MGQGRMLLHYPLEMQQKEKPDPEEEQDEEKEEVVELGGQYRRGQHREETQAGQLEVVFGLIEVKELDCLDHDEELGKSNEERGLEDQKDRKSTRLNSS